MLQLSGVKHQSYRYRRHGSGAVGTGAVSPRCLGHRLLVYDQRHQVFRQGQYQHQYSMYVTLDDYIWFVNSVFIVTICFYT